MTQTTDACRVLRALYERCEGPGFIELRPIKPRGGALKPEFFPLGDEQAVAARAVELRDLANVYFGVAPRTRRAGTKDAVEAVPAIWVDLDRPDAAEMLESFSLAPSFVVTSGTKGNLHAYWLLEEAVAPAVAEGLNAELAARLGGDPAVVDASRILRLPGTYNHKSDPPAESRLTGFAGGRYIPAQIEEASRAQSATDADAAAGPSGPSATERLLDALEGVNGHGPQWMARCPAHDDQEPSLSIKEGDDGKPVLHCFAGCTYERILDGLDPDLLAAVRRGPSPGQASPHDRVMQLITAEEVQLFHDPQERAYALVDVSGRSECLEVSSEAFRKWIRHAYYRRHTGVVPRDALAAAVELLSAQAQFDGAERPVHRRVGGDLEQLCIDIGDAARHVAVVSRKGTWTLVEQSPVLFVREPGMLPLPIPERGGSLEELRPLLNMADDRNWALYRGCLLAAFHPFGPYFVMMISGRPGTGKSSQARYFARLVDPYQAQFIVGSPKPSDLIVAASRGWLIGLDNVSRIPRDLSDVMCALATGAGDRKRALYSNADAYTLEAKRPSLVTSITRPATRGDLVDRSAPINLEGLKGWLKETELDAKYEQHRPRVFGAVLDALGGALRDADLASVGVPPRMADAALFVTAAEAMMGVAEGTFLEALKEAKGEALSETVHGSPFIEAVIRLMAGRDTWYGSPAELLEDAAAAAGEMKHSRAWPSSAGQGTTEVEENSIALEEHGIVAETRIREHGGSRSRRTRLMKRS
jgi:hypothetical protein